MEVGLDLWLRRFRLYLIHYPQVSQQLDPIHTSPPENQNSHVPPMFKVTVPHERPRPRRLDQVYPQRDPQGARMRQTVESKSG